MGKSSRSWISPFLIGLGIILFLLSGLIYLRGMAPTPFFIALLTFLGGFFSVFSGIVLLAWIRNFEEVIPEIYTTSLSPHLEGANLTELKEAEGEQENRRFDQRLDRRRSDVFSLFKIDQILGSSPEIEDVLKQVALIIEENFKIEKMAILTSEGTKNGLLVPLISRGIPEKTVDKLKFKTKGKLAQLLRKEGGALLLNKIEIERLSVKEIEALKESGCWLLIPMILHRRVRGIFILGKKPRGDDFSREEVDRLLKISHETVLLIENVKLRKTTTELEIVNRELKKRIFDLHNLFNISREINSKLDLEKLLNAFLLIVIGQIRCSSAVLLLSNGEQSSKEFVAQFYKGISEEIASKLRLKKDSGLVRLLDSLSEPLLVTALEEDPLLGGALQKLKEVDCRVYASFRVKDELEGILALGPKIDEKPYQKSDFAILSILMNQISVATENARLYEQIQKKANDLERALKQLKETQEHLIHSEKLAAVGQLAGGVAHEINNPLTAILGFAQVLLSELDSNDPRCEELAFIEKEALRCKKIVQDLLDFSRTSQPAFELIDVNQTIEETLELIRHQASFFDIKIIKELYPQLPKIMANNDKLQQVLLNLMVNARQAMPDGGELRLITNPVEGEGAVEVRIADTGHGISQENLSKIFDPFFTTKEKGYGAGLGLSVVHGIIKQHGGTITVESEVDKGTTFIIKLPVQRENFSSPVL